MEGKMMGAYQEKMIKTPSFPTKLSVCRNSHAITKGTSKPKIRIVHEFAPTVIQTEAANFRELVQRLTGKRSKDNCSASYACAGAAPVMTKNEIIKVCREPGFGFVGRSREEEEVDDDEVSILWKRKYVNP